MHSVSGWWGGKRRFIVQLAPFIRRSVNPEKGSGYNRTTGLTTPTIRVDRGPPGIAGIERDLQLNKPLLSNPRRSRNLVQAGSPPRVTRSGPEACKRGGDSAVHPLFPSLLLPPRRVYWPASRDLCVRPRFHGYCELLDKRGSGTENLAARLSYSCDVPFSTPCSSG